MEDMGCWVSVLFDLKLWLFPPFATSLCLSWSESAGSWGGLGQAGWRREMGKEGGRGLCGCMYPSLVGGNDGNGEGKGHSREIPRHVSRSIWSSCCVCALVCPRARAYGCVFVYLLYLFAVAMANV